MKGKILLVLFVILFSLTIPASTNRYWDKAEEASRNGLPKTAVENLDKIIEITLREENYSEWIQALTRKIVMEGTIQGNKPEIKVKILKKELAKTTDPESKILLQAILAEWYWHYYERNRWRFMRRTATEGMVEDDFTTWDLKKIFREIDSLYQGILKERELLIRIPIDEFNEFLFPGTAPLEYRPTLYDFIAHEALDFYTSAEQAGVRAEDVFEIDANSGAFDRANDFIDYKPVTTDTQSAKYKAIRIYQSLLKYHLEESNIEALIDVNLHRLRYIRNNSYGESKDSLYMQRLNEIVEEYKDYPLSSLAAFYLAKVWGEKDDLVKAHEIAEKGYKRFPDSPGGKSCYIYMNELEKISLSLEIERLVPPKPSKILVRYKNINRLFVRVYKDEWENFIWEEIVNVKNNKIDSIEALKFLSRRPYKEWSKNLPDVDDFKMKVLEVDVPEVEPGYYRMFVSLEEDFGDLTQVEHSWFCVSNLTLIIKERPGVMEGLVLDAFSGEPIDDAKVTEVKREIYRNYFMERKTNTNSNGFFSFGVGKKNQKCAYLQVEKGKEKIISPYSACVRKEYSGIPASNRTFFFTDRSIYRPGQIIYFKGICVHIDKEKNNFEVLPNEEVTVSFLDANSKEINNITLTTNEFGSFSGHFIAPTGRLTGRMRIKARAFNGGTWVRVEEYKRPKFTVEIDHPEKEYKLNQEINVTGKAISYTGAPIDNAKVSYRVTRSSHFPYWWRWYYWYYPPSRSGSKQIAHNITKTDDKGNFTIRFLAEPDPKISADEDPIFTYKIDVEVTSPDGETRTDKTSVSLGYSAFKIELSTEDDPVEQKDFSLTVSTQTLDGKKIPARTHLKIFKLKEPEEPIKSALWENELLRNIEPDRGVSNEEFSSRWESWPKDKLVFESRVTTEKHNPESVKVKLSTGLYNIECTALDRYGKEIKAFLPLMVLPDWKGKKFPIKLPFVVELNNNVIEVGKDLEVLWGSGYEESICFVEIEHKNNIIKRYWTDKNQTQHTFCFPVTEKFRGGFTVYLSMVKENRAYMEKIFIDVPWDNKELDISLETFRDKIKPGSKEKISLKVQGRKSEIKAAEMVASMYDFSLDQFSPHKWGKFNFFTRYSPSMNSKFINVILNFRSCKKVWKTPMPYPKINYIHFPQYLTRDFLYYQFPVLPKVTYKKDKNVDNRYGVIQGRVVDANTDEPLPGANVLILETDREVATDVNGYFTIKNVPPGKYKLQSRMMGYQSVTFTDIESKKGTVTTVNFRLWTQSIEGEGVVVQAAREVVKMDLAGGSPEPPTFSIEEEKDKKEEVKISPIDLKTVKIREDLNETAFFYPHLLMDKYGKVTFEFTSPEALTKWRFMGFAHGKKCENGIVTGYTVTSKKLMVRPNPPRFLREGDTLYFTTRVVNMSDRKQNGKVQLDFKDLITEKLVNKQLNLEYRVQTFSIKANTSKTFSWKVVVPKGMNPLTYTVVAKSKRYSDGETDAIPVLSSRKFLTESYPLYIRGKQTKNFTFDRVKNVSSSETAEPFNFTVQMTSNPTWYAIQALPYLSEFPYECSEQVFNRFYANSIGKHIANFNPRIEEILKQWRGTDALKSNLEKSADLKSVILLETPWVRQAERESGAKRNIGMFFEENTIDQNINSAYFKLKQMQNSDGGWPWFPGGKSNTYITLYILTNFGRLKNIGVDVDMSLAYKAIDYLDKWFINTSYDFKSKFNINRTSLIAFYLYGRSFYLKDKPIPSHNEEEVKYFLNWAEKHWLQLNSRLSQGYLALALNRFNRKKTARKIMASIKERSVMDEEMGMFWRELERSWWWYRAPIETQALMIEAFSEVTGDTIAVEDCKVWLLKQKQTIHWRTTKATSDAVYALILRGDDYLSSNKLVRVQLGEEEVTPEKVEAGTNFYEKFYTKDEIQLDFSDIKVTKEDKGIAWGGVYLQYFEEMSAITSHTTNLKLKKDIFIKSTTKKGSVIKPLPEILNVGDLLTVRIVLKVDRDMEYVHLKDLRGSGLEPVDVLSFYRYQDGLRYYQSTKDVATHFFIDYLPKGTYVFEYDLRVQHKGKYQSGIAEIQCMYAPEFSSHSESIMLNVQ
jgi:uncharacterized protein YfaS (alpha-2-macroglobulin family)